MAWIWLFLAGLAEIAWMVAMKFSDGFTRSWWAGATVGAMGLSVFLTSLAVRSIPMGTAYAVWTGIGAAGISVLGMMYFGEPRTALRIACIVLIVAGIVGLRIAADA
ncbi:MAG TPA: multidrug efflux SMR transporter [Alphaproteobacteria bacterium]